MMVPIDNDENELYLTQELQDGGVESPSEHGGWVLVSMVACPGFAGSECEVGQGGSVFLLWKRPRNHEPTNRSPAGNADAAG